MKKTILYILFVILIAISFMFTNSAASVQIKTYPVVILSEDLNPLDNNITVTVEIQKIRYLQPIDTWTLKIKQIDYLTNPSFYVKVFINNVEYNSPIWKYTKYVNNPNWSATSIVPKDQDFVNVKIQLWDWNFGKDRLMDICGNLEKNYPSSYKANLTYSIKTGIWWGDDSTEEESNQAEPSGFGRLNGCDDGNIGLPGGRDCELWFNIYQNDYDGDGIPYWTEVNVYNTNPTIDNRGEDADNDGVPIEWEHIWGCGYNPWHWHGPEGYYWVYNPFIWEDHANMDPDNDGLSNIDEYRTSQWGSDPFRKDIFLEIDQMEKGPNGEGVFVPDLSKEMMRDSYDRHNIVFHIDDGSIGGGEIMPFDMNTSDKELQDMYFNYFLNGEPTNWRRGVFHYALVIYHCDRYPGFVLGTTADGKNFSLDTLQISTFFHETFPFKHPLYNMIMRKSINK